MINRKYELLKDDFIEIFEHRLYACNRVCKKKNEVQEFIR